MTFRSIAFLCPTYRVICTGLNRTGLPRAKSDGVQQPRPLASFIDDATNILKSRGGTAALSHAHSSLSVCADTGAVASNVLRGPFAPEQFPGDTLDTLSVPGNGKRWRSDRWCSQYEFRVETAQKRSYASICYYTLCPTDDRRNGYCSWRQYDDESIHFISDLTALARTDIVVMVRVLRMLAHVLVLDPIPPSIACIELNLESKTGIKYKDCILHVPALQMHRRK